MAEKPRVSLARPITPYDPKPEIWNIRENNYNYLVYYPEFISSRLIYYKPSDSGFKFETVNTIYFCDWPPVIKTLSKEYFDKIRNSI